MATSKFLMQGLVKGHGHLAAVEFALGVAGASMATVSVAFATAKGVSLIAGILRKIKDNTEVFVGIRNGVTTVQAMKAFLDLGIQPYCVDTGSSSFIFHPKVYFARNDKIARVLLGSSNLTPAGLRLNFEAACLIEANREDGPDEELVSSIEQALTALRSVSSDHVYKIRDLTAAIALFEDGLLVDERRVRAVSTGTTSRQNGRGRIKVIPRIWDSTPSPKVNLDVAGLPAPTPKPRSTSSSRPSGNANPVAKTLGYDPNWELVWQSNGLSERDLNIPKGSNTNPTGSMLLKAGAWTRIDFQRYFRSTVFDRLNWIVDAAHKHLQLASARFEIRVAGISHGIYMLEIRHNSDENSKTFREKNAMTSLRWGPAKTIIARNDLLGRELRLFRAPEEDDLFLIEIE